MASVIRDWNYYVMRKERYALVDPKGKTIETFRNMDTLLDWKPKLESDYLCKLRIVKLK